MLSIAVRFFVVAFWFSVTVLGLHALTKYNGNPVVFIAFSASANVLLWNGFRRHALFFDTFIGLFFWLGFWLKASVQIAFANGRFSEPTGAFDGSGAAFDHALLVATLGFVALIAASWTVRRFFRYPTEATSCSQSGLYRFYDEYRPLVLTLFVLAVLGIAVTNVWLGIYQRGMVTRTFLPLGLNGVYKWLIQFGFASISALIIRFEIERSRKLTATAILVPMFEVFVSNVTLLSRGMILNGSALGIGTWRAMANSRSPVSLIRLAAAGALFAVLFAGSVFAVNYLRAKSIDVVQAGGASQPAELAAQAQGMTTPLFVARWVGMEGLLAVSSSQHRSWALWRDAWSEEFREGVPSLYDRLLIESPYTRSDVDIDSTKFHFVSLPGLLAFLYFPGSIPFLVFATFLAGIAAALFEIFLYKLGGGNLVLAALFGQVIAFRYASFGYVPSQSHLLFGTVLANGLLIAAAEQVLTAFYRWRDRRANPATVS